MKVAVSGASGKTGYRFAEEAISNGALGGKLLGAGGGGFILIVSDSKSRNNIKNSLKDLIEIEVNYNPKGSRILLVQ